MGKTNRDINFDFLTKEEIMELAKPKNQVEKDFLNNALKKLGDNTSVLKLANYLNVGKTTIYRAIEERKLIVFKIGTRSVIQTRSILNLTDLKD